MNLSSIIHMCIILSHSMFTAPTGLNKSLCTHIVRVPNSLEQYLLQTLPASLHFTWLYYSVPCKYHSATLCDKSSVCILWRNNVPVLHWAACLCYLCCLRCHFTTMLAQFMTSQPRVDWYINVIAPTWSSFCIASVVQLAW